MPADDADVGPHLRSGRASDVPDLVRLMLLSSHGGMKSAWLSDTRPGERWDDVAHRQVGDPGGEIGWRNAVVAERELGSLRRIVGMAILNALPRRLEPHPQRSTPAQRLVIDLFNQVIPTMMVREIAVDPDLRRQGVARLLLEAADALARPIGLSSVSLTVNEANEGAWRAYERLGFSVVHVGAAVPHPTFGDTARLVLMRRAVAP
jgi:ribosomal protein S18 acetylase RimI-like enzyme